MVDVIDWSQLTYRIFDRSSDFCLRICSLLVEIDLSVEMGWREGTGAPSYREAQVLRTPTMQPILDLTLGSESTGGVRLVPTIPGIQPTQ